MSNPPEEKPRSKMDLQKVKLAMSTTLNLVKKMGSGAAGLLAKLKKDRSPDAMLKTIEDSHLANQQRREGVSARVEKLHAEIVDKKKTYAAASPARKRILESELQSKLAEYKAAERELQVLLENERVLSQVKGRMMEVASFGMAGVSEAQIDDLIDDVEDAVGDAEGRLDAARDLEKAGRRRERESDKDALWEQLGDFGEGESSKAMEKALSDFDEPVSAPPPKAAVAQEGEKEF